MILLAAIPLSVAGFVALYLAMPRHQADALGRRLEPGAGRRLRALGWAGLLATYLASVAALGWARGSIAIVGLLALGAFIVVMLATWRARILAGAGWTALTVALLCWAAIPLLR